MVMLESVKKGKSQDNLGDITTGLWFESYRPRRRHTGDSTFASERI